jgi:hypothetical protein
MYYIIFIIWCFIFFKILDSFKPEDGVILYRYLCRSNSESIIGQQ